MTAPTLSGSGLAASVTEASTAPNSGETVGAALFGAISIADLDPSTPGEITGAVVRISSGFQSGATHQDFLKINGTTSGTIAGSGIAYSYDAMTGVMTLTGAATPAEYKAALELVRFSTSGDNITSFGAATTRQVAVSVSDGGDSSGEIFANVSVTGINDRPVNSGSVPSGPGFVEDATDIPLTGFSVSDVDANPATQAITVTLMVTHGTLDIRTDVIGGITAANITGGADGSDSITLTATQNQINATLASASGLTYTPPADFNGNPSFAIITNDGGFNGNDPGNTGTGTTEQDADGWVVHIAAVNDPVAGTAPATLSLNEDAANVAVVGMSISDVDSTLAPAGVYEVTLSSTNGTMVLTTLTGLTFSNGDGTNNATMTFRGTLADINTALATARYTPTANYSGSAQITLQVTDGFGGIVATGTGAATNDSVVIDVTVNSVNDEPAVAQGDAFTTDELTAVAGNLFADNGAGADSDPDGPPLSISEVNGSAGDVGVQITLASGALLTVNADGTFSYDPNGAFEPAPTGGSGASNTPASDSFTYTLAGGGSATVSLTITGIDNDDILLGTAGNDVLRSGTGNDTVSGLASDDLFYFGGALTPADVVDGGAGHDTLVLQGDYGSGLTLTGNVTGIEAISLLAGSNTAFGDPGTNLYDYSITTADANFAAVPLGVVTIDGANLLAGEDLTFDGSAETDASFLISGGRGRDMLSGGAQDDAFVFGPSGQFAAGDTVDGGAGFDSLVLRGNYFIDFSGPGYANVLQGIENVTLISSSDDRYGSGGGDEFDYALTWSDDLLGAGQTIIVDGGLLQATETMAFDGSSETDGHFQLSGGAGSDVLTGGGGDDLLLGGAGDDLLVGGAGNDNLTGGWDDAPGGNDTLTGGEGADLFGLRTFDNSVTITDFVSGEDQFYLSVYMDSNPDAPGLQTWYYVEGAYRDDLTDKGQIVLTGSGSDYTLSIYQAGDAIADTVVHSNAAILLSDMPYYVEAAPANEQHGTPDDDLLVGTTGDDAIYAHEGNDVVDGLEGNDLIYGGPDHDLLNGQQGNDGIYGEDGDDLIRPGTGDDTADGGDGIDRVSYASVGSDALTGGVTASLALQGTAQDTGGGGTDYLIGFEHLTGTAFDDTLTGDDGDNWLWGGSDGLGTSGNDTISGGGGNDLIEVGAGTQTLDGGDGNDTLMAFGNGSDITAAGVTISLALQGAGQDTEQGNWLLNGFENLSGSLHDDSLTGDGGDNELAGDAGNDQLAGGSGNDTLYGDGQIGVDTHGLGFSGPIAVTSDTLAGGNDLLEGGEGDDYLDGGDGSDTATYANAAGAITAQLYGGGFGEAFGADGYDQLYFIENLTGSDFDDLLFGDDDDNVLDGGDGHDGLRGFGGNDTLFGGNGDDFLNGGEGDDTLDGGSGYDRVSFFTGAIAGVTVDLNLQGVAQDTGRGLDTLVGIENVSGTQFNDTLTGDDGDNFLWGSPGTLSDGTISADNNDTLTGNGGNDLLIVGIGNHSLSGGSGTDTVGFTENGAAEPGLTISLELQGAAQATGAGNWTLDGIENLSGGLADDSLTGDGNGNVLAGNSGDDYLAGGGANDILYGDGLISWDSHGTGGSGAITTWADVAEIGGVSGNDTLEGGLGDDQLYGGGGNDTASYANAGGGVQAFLYNGGFGEVEGADGYDQLFDIENITGSAFDDALFGNNQDNVLSGGDGHDFLRGNGGNDSLYAGNGDDYVSGSVGDDLLDGGAGWDRVSYFAGAVGGVTVDLNIQGVAQDTGLGNDTLVDIEHLSGTAFGDSFTGNGGDNWLWGASDGTGNDTIDGQDGNDLIEDGAGDHILSGGLGTDTFRYSVTATAIGINVTLAQQGVAQDTGVGMMTLTGFENLSGSIHSDVLNGDENDNVLAGAEGHDAMAGGAGNDTIYGDGSINPDTHGIGGSGPITTTADIGAAGNDSLEGGLGDDWLEGGAGNDTAHYVNASGAVQVTLFNNDSGDGESFGADGNDTLIGIENVTGSAFNDTIVGSSAGNTLYGNEGNDFLQARGGDDTVHGGAGNDYLGGGTGNDYLDGGDGFDRASFSNGSTGPVTVDLRLQGTAQNTGLGIDTLVDIENVTGTAFGDTLTGDDEDNWLWGATDAAGIADTIDGQGGNDLIEVGAGNHIVSGGSGTDTLLFNPFAPGSLGGTISLALQGAAQDTGSGMMTLSGIENLSGSSFDDSLTGDGNANVLAGSEGNDSLAGGAGNDALYGDGFIGTQGSPSGPITTYEDVSELGGVSGDDTLEGGDGNDQLFGGGGNDTASYAAAAGAVFAGLGAGGSGGSFGAAGNDSFNSIENLTGSDFNDQFGGNDEINVLTGNGGHDIMVGRGGDDVLIGGDGDDYLRGDDGDAGDDIIDGGSGWDRAAFNLALAGVTIDLNIQGVAQDTGLGMDTLISIEHASGSTFNDTIIGDGGDNWLRTWGGDDVVSGNGGNDLIETMPGNNVVDGGSGVDSWSFYGDGTFFSSGVTVSLALQGTAQDTGQGVMLATGFENLSGTIYGDTLVGDNGGNVLAGDLGDDTLRGGAGNDVLLGDGSIFVDWHGDGGSGPITQFADITGILGGVAGNDLLEGGLGNDALDGAGGIDTASYANASGGVNVNLGSGLALGADGDDTLANIENAIGSQFGDTLNGSGGDNVLEGLGGNDIIQGQGGNDTIYGGDGDDTLRGDAGELSLAVSGDDVIHGGNGNDGLRGGLGDDQLYGGANNDLMRGNGGVDYFDGGADDGEGFNGIGDRVSFFDARATQGAVADLRTGVISNDGFGNAESMVGIESLGADTAYVDTFYGNDARNFIGGSRGDHLFGFGDNDSFQMGSAAAVVDGGSGIDTLGLDSSGGWLTPDADADGLAESAAAALVGWTVNLAAGTIVDGYGNSGSVTGIENVTGSQLGDTLTGDANANVLNGGDGDDTLQGGLGDDTLDGGNGSDTASYANASGSVTVTLTALGGSSSGADGVDSLTSVENVTGSAFNDTLVGNGGVNLIQGGDGHDVIRGGGGNDTIEGGGGDDFLRGDDGDDLIRGGDGFDRVGFASSAVGVTVNLTIVGAQATGQGSDTFDGIEHVSGTQFNDVITGNSGDNWLWGGSNGAGVTGNDVINGGGGNDLIEVGAGTHTLNGGTGTGDTLSFRGNGTDISAAGITYSLANQGANQNTEQGMMLTSGFENVSGSIHADTIIGNSAANTLAGDIGNDTLRGEDGNDIIYGDGRIGVDSHGIGGSGPITTWHDITSLSGDPGGNDTLLGGRGDDFLYGGRGDDTMTGNQGVDRFVIEADSGDDRITDFAPGVDKIRFDGVAGVDDFADLTLVRVGSNTVISWGTSDSITVLGLRPTQLTASNFEFASSASLMAADADFGEGSGIGRPFESGFDGALAIASISLV